MVGRHVREGRLVRENAAVVTVNARGDRDLPASWAIPRSSADKPGFSRSRSRPNSDLRLR
jgi:hypothetical protein